MKKQYIVACAATGSAYLCTACAAVGELLPGGEAQAEDVGNAILANAPALAEQGGMLTTMFTGNPALGGAVATLLTGAAGVFAAKKIKAKKAAGAPPA